MRCKAQEETCERLQQENQHLLQNLQEQEREHKRLKTAYNSVTKQLSQFHKRQGEIDDMKKQAATISEAMTAKSAEASGLKEEKDSLKAMLDEKALELEQQKFQVHVHVDNVVVRCICVCCICI